MPQNISYFGQPLSLLTGLLYWQEKKKMTNFCRTAGDGEPGGRDETIVAIN